MCTRKADQCTYIVSHEPLFYCKEAPNTTDVALHFSELAGVRTSSPWCASSFRFGLQC
jgi:hypothetical protein